MWQFLAILAIYGMLWRFIFPKIAKKWKFDLDVLGFEKFIYLMWRQIWQFLPNVGDFLVRKPGHTGTIVFFFFFF